MLDLSRCNLFTHAGCLDGAACAVLFIRAGGNRDNIRYLAAGTVDEFFNDNRRRKWDEDPLLFVDVSPRTEDVIDYISHRNDALVIDHHKSSEKLAGTKNFIIDAKNSACGCENMRVWLVDSGLSEFDAIGWKRFTHIVDDHDRWLLNVPFSLEMPKMLSFIGQKEFVEMMINADERFAVESDSYWNVNEKMLMDVLNRNQERRFKSLLTRFITFDKKWEERDVKIAYIVSSEQNCSELLNLYLSQHPEIDISCQINLENHKVSVRSNGKVDLSKWTKQYGGGGHANSAGHQIDSDLLSRIIIGELHGKF